MLALVEYGCCVNQSTSVSFLNKTGRLPLGSELRPGLRPCPGWRVSSNERFIMIKLLRSCRLATVRSRGTRMLRSSRRSAQSLELVIRRLRHAISRISAIYVSVVLGMNFGQAKTIAGIEGESNAEHSLHTRQEWSSNEPNLHSPPTVRAIVLFRLYQFGV